MGKSTSLIIISVLSVVFMFSCEKEDEINDHEPIIVNTDISIKLGGALCAYNAASRTFYFPIISDTIEEYITLVNYSCNLKDIYLDGKKLINKSYNDLGTIYVNRPYELKVINEEEINVEYKLVFTTLSIIQIFTDLEIVDEPKTIGKLIINNPYYQNNNEISRETEVLAGIEIRGNIYLGRPKSSYGFEIWKNEYGEENKDISLLGLRMDDDWILDGMYGDLMRMRNRISFEIWNSIARLYYSDKEPEVICGIRGKFVEVFINNEYQGLYSLNEKLDRKQLKLKTFTNITRGILYKGEDWGDGVTSFYNCKDTTSDIIWDGWEQLYPKPEQQILWAPLYNFIKLVVESDDNEFKDSINQLIDINSIIDYYIFINYIGATDNTGKNTFIARYDKNDIFFLAPWDMDWSFGRHWDTIAIGYTGMSTNNLFERMLSANPGDYRSKLKERWTSLRENELDYENVISHFEKYKNMLTYSGVIYRENNRWRNANVNLESELILIKDWLENRINYLDNYFNDL